MLFAGLGGLARGPGIGIRSGRDTEPRKDKGLEYYPYNHNRYADEDVVHYSFSFFSAFSAFAALPFGCLICS
jgi:hypothetical protein